jgi:hypothetical protein
VDNAESLVRDEYIAHYEGKESLVTPVAATNSVIFLFFAYVWLLTTAHRLMTTTSPPLRISRSQTRLDLGLASFKSIYVNLWRMSRTLWSGGLQTAIFIRISIVWL